MFVFQMSPEKYHIPNDKYENFSPFQPNQEPNEEFHQSQ